MAATLIGKEMEVQFVEETYKGRTGVKANQRIGGRYAFPDPDGPQPKNGDQWKVRVSKENPAGSIYRLLCLTRVSTAAERRAAANAEQTASQERWRRHESLRPAVQSWLDSFSQWTVKEYLFELEKVQMALRPQPPRYRAEAHGLVVEIEPRVECLGNTSTFNKVEIVLPYDALMVERVYLRDPANWRQLTAVVATDYGRCELFFADYIGEAHFLGWERTDNALTASVSFGLNGAKETVTVIVAEFKIDQAGRAEINWKVSDYGRRQPEKIDHYLPEVPQEHVDWLNGLVAAREAAVDQTKTVGLLTFGEDSRAPQELKKLFDELGYGGIGWSPYGVRRGEYNSPYVIHPALAPLMEGLPAVTLQPAIMREHAPETAWATIQWSVGPEPPSAKTIECLRSETIEVEEKVDIQEWLQNYGQLPVTPLPCVIVCRETEKGTDVYGRPAKYVFDAQVAAPIWIRTHRKYTFGTYGAFSGYRDVPVLAERIESRLASHVFKDIATGNEFFEGESALEVVLAGRKRNLQWVVRWTAPETKQEETGRKTEAIRELIRGAREYGGIALTGWRYTDTGNPVVMTGGLMYGYWAVREFDRETYQIGKRKGFGSNKGNSRSTELGPRDVAEALAEYRDHGWPVAPDEDWQVKAGKSILSIFPPALIEKLQAMEGGE